MENCRQGGGKKTICNRPDPHRNNETEDSVQCDTNRSPTEEIAHDHQSTMANLKSAPSSVK